MVNELGNVWKEAVLAYFKVPYYPGICLEGMRKAAKDLVSTVRSLLRLEPGTPRIQF
jgi:hypothetical protein